MRIPSSLWLYFFQNKLVRPWNIFKVVIFLHSFIVLQVLLCTECNSLIAPTVILESKSEIKLRKKICKACQSSKSVCEIGIPYALRYLLAELASINVNVKIILENNDKNDHEYDDNVDTVLME